MSLYKRGDIWWCNFTVKGKRIQCSTGATDREAAKQWEKEKINSLAGETVTAIAMEKVKRALVGKRTSFEDAWIFFRDYPRRRMPSDNVVDAYYNAWCDFVAFARSRGASDIGDIDDQTASAYIGHIRSRGRFGATKPAQLSARTQNWFISFFKLFFRVMTTGRMMLENPFQNVARVSGASAEREIFTEQELAKLQQRTDHPLYPVICFGIYTGLRLGDIVRLRWSDIDQASGWINVSQSKTARPVSIPIVAPLGRFIATLPRSGEYLLPELRSTYERDHNIISQQFKHLLFECGIHGATVSIKGRTRRHSKKDIHSLRHTFAYMAGKHRIPAHIVQLVLGHMTPAMTRHYMAHANRADMQQAMAGMPDLMNEDESSDRDRLRAFVESITPVNLDRVKRHLLAALEKK